MSKAQEFLLEAATYFENRPTNGEDKAHWSNVYNAKNCRDIARKYGAMIEALEAIIESGALEFATTNQSPPGAYDVLVSKIDAALSKARAEA